MEILSDILRAMRVRGSVFFCDHREAPWTEGFANDAAASFHVVRRGECWAQAGARTEYLGPGDMLVVAPGQQHELSSDPPGQAPRNPGAETLLLCGYWEFSRDTVLPMSDLFPAFCIIRAEEFQKNPWLRSAIDQLSAEYLSNQPGAELVVDKLTEIVVVELIRISFGQSENNRLIRALADRHVASALQEIHGSPESPWTIDRLAKQVGLSRAAFAKRFRELVGQPVFEYLTQVRIQRAGELLRGSALPVWEIANRVGYESEVAFVRMFRKQVGTTPARYRATSAQAAGFR